MLILRTLFSSRRITHQAHFQLQYTNDLEKLFNHKPLYMYLKSIIMLILIDFINHISLYNLSIIKTNEFDDNTD